MATSNGRVSEVVTMIPPDFSFFSISKSCSYSSVICSISKFRVQESVLLTTKGWSLVCVAISFGFNPASSPARS